MFPELQTSTVGQAKVMAIGLGLCSMHSLVAINWRTEAEVTTSGLILAAVKVNKPKTLQAKKLQLSIQDYRLE